MCTISKSAHTKKNLETYRMHLVYTYRPILQVGKMFANDQGDRSSIPGRVLPKTQKIVIDTSLLKTQHYNVRIKGKWNHPRKVIALSSTPQCNSYRKRGVFGSS